MFFELSDSLCQKYTALTPFMVRREKFGEVVKLLGWINSSSRRKSGMGKTDTSWRDKRGNLHIRRQAQNDNWY
jgi:hypothetical protein